MYFAFIDSSSIQYRIAVLDERMQYRAAAGTAKLIAVFDFAT